MPGRRLRDRVPGRDMFLRNIDGMGSSAECRKRKKDGVAMSRFLRYIAPAALVLSFPAAAFASGPYENVPVEQVFERIITRERYDSVYSGQIRDAEGLAEFERNYGVEAAPPEIDFKKQMLVFGINDNLSSRAFQLLQQDWSVRSILTLDYYDTGIRYRLALPPEGKKTSRMQVFIMERIDGVSHVRVKDLVRGLSKVYGGGWKTADFSPPEIQIHGIPGVQTFSGNSRLLRKRGDTGIANARLPERHVYKL